jgi:hypothetical protein
VQLWSSINPANHRFVNVTSTSIHCPK